MTIDRSTVIHVAKLARLQLHEQEIGAFEADLRRIVGYVDQLSELDTDQVPETAHMAVDQAPERPDVVQESLPNARAVDQGPRVRDGAFAVPAFIDEG